jgi:hypothetical protein
MDAAPSSETSETSFRLHDVTLQMTANSSSQCALFYRQDASLEFLTAEIIKTGISSMWLDVDW